MSKSGGGNGIGSASLVLMFAVLCMTIFTLISLSSAVTDKAMADAQEKFVKDYYDADVRAEYVLAEILKADFIPETVGEVSVVTRRDQDSGARIASFVCVMSDKKELSVEIAIFESAFDVLKWKVQDIGKWEIDTSLPVWQGD